MKKLMPVLGVILFTSCTVQREVKKETNLHDPEVKTTSVGMVVKPIVADLKIDSEKKSVTYTADLKLPLSEIKDNAMELFLKTYKCDYVIDPIYSKTTIVENSQLDEIQLTITGFPATYSKIYQVDSLPKSVEQYASLNLPVKRVEYTNSIVAESKGKPFGMEFSAGLIPGGFTSAQIDYGKRVDGLHMYFSAEKYSQVGYLNFDYKVNELTFSFNNVGYNHTAFSLGVFKEKILSKRFKLRGFGGLNLSNMQFLANQSNAVNKVSFFRFNNIGLRFGAAFDYKLIEGISFVGKVHSNLGLLNLVGQNGEYISKVTNIKNSDYPLVNFSAGIRFNF